LSSSVHGVLQIPECVRVRHDMPTTQPLDPTIPLVAVDQDLSGYEVIMALQLMQIKSSAAEMILRFIGIRILS
jgi:hypothetical protein